MNEIAYVGDGIKKKVAELIKSGKIDKLESLKQDEKLVCLDKLQLIWGVGPAAAEKLYCEHAI